MLLLSSLLFLFLIAALVLFLYPLKKDLKQHPIYFAITSSFLIIFTVVFYLLTGDKVALNQWLNQGKQHIRLLESFEALGGVDGAISKIKMKLQENPLDAQGWYILAKLYSAQGDKTEAIKSIKQAIKIAPTNTIFTDYLKKLNGE